MLGLLLYLKKGNKHSQTYIKNIFLVVLIFWFPLYLIFFYNSIYDLVENIDYFKLDNYTKSKERLCNIDARQNSGGIWCRIFPTVEAVKENTETGSKIGLITPGTVDPYFYYFLYPHSQVISNIKEADYILFYYPTKIYTFDGESLFEGSGELKKEVGNYELAASLGRDQILLKKITNK